MHGSLSKQKAEKGGAFDREIMIRQETGTDFDKVYEVVKVFPL